MESEKVFTEKTNWKFEKKTDGWTDDIDNYFVPHELTITITLREYRDLVKKAAKSDFEMDKLKEEKSSLRQKVDKLESEITGLRNALVNCPMGKESAEGDKNV